MMNFPYSRALASALAGSALLCVVTVAQADDTTSRTTTHRKHVAAATTTATKSRPAKKVTAIPTRDGRGATYADGNVVGGANGHERAVLTGSQIPRDYNRRGYTTDSRDNNYVYDKNDIRLQSRRTVQDSLRDVPGVNVRGMR